MRCRLRFAFNIPLIGSLILSILVKNLLKLTSIRHELNCSRLRLANENWKNMRNLSVCFVLLIAAFTSAHANNGLDIKMGSADLFENSVLSRPFTVFDQLLYNLEKRAKDVTLTPLKNEFRAAYGSSHVSAGVRYERRISRIGLVFKIMVSGMDDPWRRVCEFHLTTITKHLWVANLGSQAPHSYPSLKDGQKKFFYSLLLGPVIDSDALSIESLQPFLDALVIVLEFEVISPNTTGIAYVRQCALDVKTDHITYQEHKN